MHTILWNQKYYWFIYLPVSWIESTFHWRFICTCIEFSAYVAHIIHADMSVIFCIIRAICLIVTSYDTGPRSAVGNVSGYRCVSDCRSRGHEFDPGLVPYFRGDWSWNNFYGHSPPFRWFIQEGLLSVTSESMCTNYWLTACLSLPRKTCG